MMTNNEARSAARFAAPDAPIAVPTLADTAVEGSLASVGRLCFAAALLGFGAEHVVTLDFATRVLPPFPLPDPLRSAFALLAAAGLAASGILILLRRRLPLAGGFLAALYAAGLLLVSAPKILAHWRVGAAWTNPCKVLVLIGGALLVAALTERDGAAHPVRLHRAWTVCRAALALFLTLGGVQHFVYADFVQTLVPRWCGAPLFWTYAAGVGLVVCGLGLTLPRTARAAGLVAGAMIFTWFLVLHIPRAVGAWTDAGEWSGVCESLAIAGIAWLVAACSTAPLLTRRSS